MLRLAADRLDRALDLLASRAGRPGRAARGPAIAAPSTRAGRGPAAAAAAGRRLGRAAAPLLAALALAGCTTHERAYPGADPAVVWSAAQATARNPDYASRPVEERWNVDRNEVLVDESAARIELYRELSRTQVQPRGERFVERRTWQLGIALVPDAEAPRLVVRSRAFAVPMHLRAEAEWYLDQVAELLEPGLADEDLPPRPSADDAAAPGDAASDDGTPPSDSASNAEAAAGPGDDGR